MNIQSDRFDIQKNLDLVLGLDLAGGSHLVFEADLGKIADGEKKEALDAARNIIEQRVNMFGTSEANVQTSSFEGKDRIIVELPGISDPRTASEIIGKTAQLDFREFINPQDATIGATLANTISTGFTGADFKKASPAFDQNAGRPVISFETKPDAAKKFGEITTRLVGKPLAIFLDASPISWPTVQEPITQGTGQITGGFTVEETKFISKLLNAGALPVPVTLIEERTVGATLGAESIARSVRAGLVGLSMVLLFMVLEYGKLGLVADIGLIIFGVLTLALYKLVPVVLTLPGIAGFLLSVGMAVDSNILIFERFKEEKVRRPVADALEVSFGRAWDSIRDANISTLVTAFVLANPLDWQFLNTSGPVRGFAITLALGIGLSLFTGIVVSRNLLRVFIREGKVTK
ncbi:protein-export membrane protein SecD [Candidatus Woesebacteria bacterium RBG_13_46_13]|uniref:Protein translocase subunit SecD n=1 Tax=Candidatus Woesebacteria bacterium RBG_13_46_13 TaxID=1802479 RepID=A0A1F7X5L7_9BACT|nr:MAG: protein-export membrane protein SecD [Candidatus Woesebacteria bacterium RBG_13_46_13]